MNNLGYTNKELAEMLGDKSLKSNTVYFFNYMRDYPQYTIQRQYLSCMCHTPMKAPYVGECGSVTEAVCYTMLLLFKGLIDEESFAQPCVWSTLTEWRQFGTMMGVRKEMREMAEERPECRRILDQWFDFVLKDCLRFKFLGYGMGKLMKELLSTGSKFLCYAHPNDSKYGINMSQDDAVKRCVSPLDWEGENVLGRMLMEVRDECLRFGSRSRLSDDGGYWSFTVSCEKPWYLKPHTSWLIKCIAGQACKVSVENVEGMVYRVETSIPKTRKFSFMRKHIIGCMDEYPTLEVIND